MRGVCAQVTLKACPRWVQVERSHGLGAKAQGSYSKRVAAF